MKQTLALSAIILLVASCILELSHARVLRNLNEKPQDALGIYDNPYIPPAVKGILTPIIPDIPNPPNDPFFPPQTRNRPAPSPPAATLPWPFSPAPPSPPAATIPQPVSPAPPSPPVTLPWPFNPSPPTPAAPKPPSSTSGINKQVEAPSNDDHQ